LTPQIEEHPIVTSWLNRLPGIRHYYRYLLPLMPSAARRLKLRGYDLVVAVSHCVAHGVDVAGDVRFVCYCLTPMRYIWDVEGSYFAGRLRRDLRYRLLRRLGAGFRRWDRRAAEHVTDYVTISRAVQERVKRCYGRDSVIIHPPVDTDFYRPLAEPPGDFYLWAGALAPYKRMDLVLEAFGRLDSRLVVIGDGQDLSWARRTATPNVEFMGYRSNDVLRRYYSSCRALIFPGEDDFGIVPVEAQACGRPVIAYGKGGILDTVVPLEGDGSAGNPTGVLFTEPTADGLIGAIRRFERCRDRFDPAAIRARALRFSRERCKAALKDYLLGA
jgi:glycosyltransferase involved in cell wall biosynthesis